jgi:hypothetical protein
MKAAVCEFDGCFSIELRPETLEEVTMLSRMKMNCKKEIRTMETSFRKDGSVETYIVFPRAKRSRCVIR